MSKYIGNLAKSDEVNLAKFNADSIVEAQRSENPGLIALFWKRFNKYPCTLVSLRNGYDERYVQYANTVKLLKKKYEHDVENDVIQYHYDPKYNYTYVQSQICELADDVFVHFYDGMLKEDIEPENGVEVAVEDRYHIISSIKVYFLPNKYDFVDELMKSLIYVKQRPYATPETYLQMVCKNQYGFYLTSVKIKKPAISDLKLHYGDEFEKIHNTITEALKTDNSHGLILLHGLPGSGKTHYIRYLIQMITEKQMIYLPPDMTSSISSPDFFPFMLQNSNSILIIEDAENIIKSRDSKETTTQAVANLLNLSDGLLGDSLNQPIIATFNCELNSVDPALLRKGRLIAQYEFGKLSLENSQKLSDQLGFKTTITEPMTLAEIYGQEKSE